MDKKVVPYKKEYRDACVEIFKSNIGQYFDESELEGFEDFLVDQVFSTKYFVVFFDDKIIGCGGYYLRNGEIRLIDGMIGKKNHKTGAGVFLLEYRVKKAIEEYPDKRIGIDTSQYTEGFFKKYGFVTIKVIKDHYGSGIDKVSMEYNP